MRVLFTGISGSEKGDLAGELAAHCNTHGHNVGVFDIGKTIFEIIDEQKLSISDGRILDVDTNLLKALRVAACERILRGIESVKDAFISIHLTFRWRNQLLPGFNFSDIMKLKPDVYINVVDNLKEIHERIRHSKEWERTPTLDDLNTWLDEEDFVTRTLADFQQKPCWVIARDHYVDNLAKLLFDSAMPRMYLSYPITTIRRERPQLLATIQQFGRDLTARFVVFDPLHIKDMELAHATEKRHDSLETGALDIMELNETVVQQVKHRTVTRDYRFIDQSDFIVVYYPTDKLSPGVISEMIYAHTRNKSVYAIFDGQRSPFFERYCTRIFPDIAAFTEFADAALTPCATGEKGGKGV
ncbi:AAA family ATPase [bacterium]|nr:AAA family ATPase [bacterium]